MFDKKEFASYICMGILSMVGVSCYVLADTYFISAGAGHMGLTALNLVLPVFSLIFGTGALLGIGGATRYAIARAQGDRDTCDRAFSTSIYSGAILGILFFVLCFFGSDTLIRLLGADDAVFALANRYLKTVVVFSPAFVLNYVYGAFVRNDGAPRLATVAMLVGNGMNILLDWVFVFPLGLGMFGAALATGVSPVISTAILLLHRKPGFHLKKPTLKSLIDNVRLGSFSFVTELSGGFVTLIFNFLILKLSGNLGVAAYGIVANISIVFIAVFNGVGQGAQPLVSRAYGRGDEATVRSLRRACLLLGGAISLILYVVIFCFTDLFVSVFNSTQNADLARIAAEGMRLYFLGMPFAVLNIVAATCLSAVDRPKRAFGISMLRGCVAVAVFAFLLAHLFGMRGVWLSLAAAEAVTLLVALWFLRKQKA